MEKSEKATPNDSVRNANPEPPLIEARGLETRFPIRRGILRRAVGHVSAVDGVDLSVGRGETLGLVGESGSGKTTLGRSLIRLVQPTGGEVVFRPQGKAVDLMRLEGEALRAMRREMQYVFQDPYSSLNPWMTVFDILAEPLVVNRLASGAALRDRVEQAIRRVGLKPEHLERYPHAFSGGQRQRIGIARALIADPKLVVADEPVSALDVSVQAQVLNLLRDLQAERGLAYLFITHDLSVVSNVADRIAVMYLGQIVELAPSEKLIAHPLHPYTQALLSAIPKPVPKTPRSRLPLKSAGIEASQAESPGCKFLPRCPLATGACRQERPVLREAAPGRWTRACAPCLEAMG